MKREREKKCFHATCNYGALFSEHIAVESYFHVIHKNSRQQTTANLGVFRRKTFHRRGKIKILI
jgi:hypothetical protein